MNSNTKFSIDTDLKKIFLMTLSDMTEATFETKGRGVYYIEIRDHIWQKYYTSQDTSLDGKPKMTKGQFHWYFDGQLTNIFR
jgi:hypothetical protein